MSRRRTRRVRVIDGHVVELDEATSLRMGRVRQNDTTPELAVRAVLSEYGLRYRVRNRDLPGSPDIANRKHKWAIFVHGCYWHRHPGCSRTTTPKKNASFWRAKFAANVARDKRTQVTLKQMGYVVLTVWECETEEQRVLKNRLSRLLGRTHG